MLLTIRLTQTLDKLTPDRGNGTFEAQDGQSITWISYDMVRSVDDRWVFHGIILFDNTQCESLSLLNNSIVLMGVLLATIKITSGF